MGPVATLEEEISLKNATQEAPSCATGSRPPGFEEVPVGQRGTFYIEFFQLMSFVGGQAGPEDYVKVVSSALDNFHKVEKLISNFRHKHLHLLKNSPFSNPPRTTKGVP